ncbi:MAG: FHA domain-containing protein, partial [Actinomycetota bacterium]|nr:FHA domain-containing protein [Actinomycetota bacterium]
MIPVVAAGDQRVDCEVAAGPTATFADLLAALEWAGPMAVDGRVVGAGDALDTDLKAGAVLTTASVAPSAPSDGLGTEHARFQFQVLAGPGAGMAVPLNPGRHVVGSGEEADVRLRTKGVAARHALVDIGDGASLRSRGRRRRLDADCLLVLGETLASVAAAPESVRSGVSAATPTIPFNRRPRAAAAVTDAAVVLPDPPPPDPTPRRLG